MVRDIGATNPYHVDGDIDMYTEENIKIREELRANPDILSSLSQVFALLTKRLSIYTL